MIIYGWNSSSLAQSTPNDLKCPNCEATGTTTVDVSSRYAHVFWIPIFPYGKTGFSQCSGCGHELKKRKMSEEIKREYNFLKADKRPPIWHFSGAFILVCAGLFLWNKSMDDDKKYHAYIESPQESDVYYYKTDDGNFSTYAVYGSTDDSIELIPNNYVFSKRTGIEAIEGDSNYADFYYAVSKDQVIQWLESDTIYKVKRKELESDEFKEEETTAEMVD